MIFERPQKGNPHKIVVNQHIFPRMSIDRFSNESGYVQLNNLRANKIHPVKPSDVVFCALRVWDQRAESGYMKSLEDNFQELVNKVISKSDETIFSQSEKILINRFYALWVLRYHYANNPETDKKLYDSSRNCWSKDEQEQLEKAGINFISNNGELLGRHIVGSSLQTQIGDIALKFMDAEWGVVKSQNLEFVVPDCPVDFLAIPITPKICLYSKSKNVVASDSQVRFINDLTIKSSRKYYFARDLEKCIKVS